MLQRNAHANEVIMSRALDLVEMVATFPHNATQEEYDVLDSVFYELFKLGAIDGEMNWNEYGLSLFSKLDLGKVYRQRHEYERMNRENEKEFMEVCKFS